MACAKSVFIYMAVLTATANMDLVFAEMKPVKADGSSVQAPAILDFTKNPDALEVSNAIGQTRSVKKLVSKR